MTRCGVKRCNDLIIYCRTSIDSKSLAGQLGLRGFFCVHQIGRVSSSETLIAVVSQHLAKYLQRQPHNIRLAAFEDMDPAQFVLITERAGFSLP
jgi:hypothetical protein